MKSLTAALFFALLAMPARAADAPKAEAPNAPKAAAPKAAPKSALNTEDEKTFYSLGLALGGRLSEFSLSASELKFVRMGFEDGAMGRTPQADLQVYGPKIDALQQARVAAKAEKEKVKSKAFLEKAAKAPGAVALPSGLIYTETQAGKGESPKATDKVKVHYHGTLTNGRVFDSSKQRGQPAEFTLNQVIPCWTEGVQKMKVGGKAKLVCPSSIAYGDRGAPPIIPGGAALVFEVELIDIMK